MERLFTLETTPSIGDAPYLWADYIELLCTANRDEEISLTSFLDRIKERDESNRDKENSNYNDKLRARGKDWFRHLSFRKGVFSEFYPFDINGNGEILTLKKPISLPQQLYIYLLMSSNLRYCDRTGDNVNTLTGDFEYLSHLALKKCLPGWEIFIFGKGKFTHERYKGNTWTKLNSLAKDLAGRVQAAEEEFSPTSTGDEGLDLVGWFPLDDDGRGTFTVFGQCACTDEWTDKQETVTFNHWRHIIDLQTDFYGVTFIPICFRNTYGTWHSKRKIYTILIDRVRFITLIREGHLQFQNLKSYALVQRFISEKESLF